MSRLLTLILISLSCACLSHAQEAAAPVAVEATDAASVDASVGKVIVTHGTVDRIEVMKTEHRKVMLKGSKFFLFISAKDFQAHADWNLDSWVGKEIFATGLVKVYYSQKEMVLNAPSQIGATAAELKAPAAAPDAPATPPASGEIQVDPAKVSLSQLRIQIQGPKTARAVKLVSESMELSWTNASSRSTTGKPLRFEGGGYSTKGREPADAAVSIITERHGGAWPAGKVAQITRLQTGEGAGWPSTFTTAVMLEAGISGWKLPPNLLVVGDLAAGGALTGGANEVYRWLQQAPAGNSILLVPSEALAALEDQWLQGSVTSFSATRIFGVQSLDEAGTVLDALSHQTWEAQLTAWGEFEKALATKGNAYLRSAEARAALTEVTRFCPSLLNAKVLQAAAEGKGPKAYSLNGSAQRLHALHTEYMAQRSLLQTDSPESRKKARDLKDALLAMKPLTHARHKTVVTALETLFDAVMDAVRFDLKDTSARAKKAASALDSASFKAAAEVLALEPEIGVNKTAN